ncbi:MAG TPA: Z1 domain-containing protein [Tepidiformaceae bacterium]|nr:Z1 domain-containing protein [Tepidiformaceae bacterium]
MDNYETALRIAMALLRDEAVATPELVAAAVERAASILSLPASFDPLALRKDIESRMNIWIGTGATLDSAEGHIPWLEERSAKIDWRYWRRYERYLEEEKRFAPNIVRRLGQLTDEVLRRLEDPFRKGEWDRRGLVVGQVQSGKTSNYAGLICKAADAGYRLIVVLTGRTNSLRSQTQLRLDEAFLGFDTRASRFVDPRGGANQKNRLVGVGLFGLTDLFPMSATNSEESGDFNQRVANQYGIIPGGNQPILLVVKKHGGVLNNVISWATSINVHVDPETGHRVVRDVPLLLIDDEADDASINTNPVVDENGVIDEDVSPTVTNKRIRQLLNSFEKSAYVGYTATPYANIFIHPGGELPELGPDLFPRHFVVSLPAASNYIGPARVFGLQADAATSVSARPPIPVVRDVNDFVDWIPDRHRKSHVPGELPSSLREAVRAFILSCAARLARGQGDTHNSMLVHVTRFTDVQERVTQQLKDELTFLQRQIRYGSGNASVQLRAELRRLWEKDFEPTAVRIRENEPELAAEIPDSSWDSVEVHLTEAAERIRVKTINGAANDALEYWDHPNGLYVIAIGGDKLSRGLTLEGLTVSYYLRASQMYDTLMQMGRWFGFRDGYLDLCRLYTTPLLQEWYRHITAASEELRSEFQRMAELGQSPEDFGLRVRTHPSGLRITSAGKMRHGTPMRLSFAGHSVESRIISLAEPALRANASELLSLLSDLQMGLRLNHPQSDGNWVWRNVEGERVARFFSNLRNDSDSSGLANRIAQFITAQLRQNELTTWTVVLVSNSSRDVEAVTYAGDLRVGLTSRDGGSDPTRLVIERVGTPADEAIDLAPEQRARALARTIERWRKSDNPRKSKSEPSVPSGPDVREERAKESGLLLLYPLSRPQPPSGDGSGVPFGFVVNFPNSSTAQAIDYSVNDIYRQLELRAL